MKNILRDTILVRLNSESSVIESKMMIRTSPTSWRGTSQPIILPFSIHSAIHEGISGTFKIISFLKAIKSNTNGKVTVLLCEGAHLHVLSLKYMGDMNAAMCKCRKDAENLLQRFKDELIECTVLFWDDFINKDIHYNEYKKIVMSIYESDEMMRLLINNEAEKSYTATRAYEYPDKFVYINKAILDLIEMTIAIKIMYESNHKIHIYPGPMPKVVLYLQPYLFPEMMFVNAHIKQKENKSEEIISLQPHVQSFLRANET